jgi:hypothetical protein
MTTPETPEPMTLAALHDALGRVLERHPGDGRLPVVLSRDAEGNGARVLVEVEHNGRYRPQSGRPLMGELPTDDDADTERDLRCVILWPAL